ncbi:MAG: hypothetical protein H0T68_06450 [Gemmatimonadales bacterium]|nr:hypothetical protein [Gemmatimonadales bacterium]
MTEVGLQAVGTASDPPLAVGGGYAALRVSRRFRLSLAAGVGGSDDRIAGRGELLAHFLLAPRARRGVGGYVAAGIAAVGGPVDQGYLVLTLGLEASPGAESGWFLEGGVGGGARLAAGYRWRRFPGWWLLGE